MSWRRSETTAAVLVCLAAWALAHAYKGIFHDAQLYTLQALARLMPAPLTHDVFLRFGSQDRYTLFSPIYAAAIRLFGLDHASEILTFGLQVAFVAAAATLARQMLSTRLTLLGMTVLIAIPGSYGAERIFTCIEPFITPRMAAEALVMFSLAAALRGREVLSLVLVLAAALLHPIMAAAGVVALAWRYLRRQPLWVSFALVGAALLALIGLSAMGTPQSRFDPTWLALLRQRSPYLFLADWSLEDWAQAIVPFMTLALASYPQANSGAEPTASSVTTLASLALLTALSGILLTLVACDALHIVLLTQLQPWRWQWLATAVSALLLPAVLLRCWQNEVGGSATAALLVAAWIVPSGSFALVAAGAALATRACLHRLQPSTRRLLFCGACGVLALTLAARIATNLLFTEAYFADSTLPLWLRKSASFCHDGLVPVTLAVSIVLLARQQFGRIALGLVGATTLAACVLLAPVTWRQWTPQQFSTQLRAQFAPWRALIPADQAVFWSEAPLQTWVLLERSSYLSVAQTSGMVFSRSAALEMRRRAVSLQGVTSPDSFLSLAGTGAGIGPPARALSQACDANEFDYLVSGARLDWAPLAMLPPQVWPSSAGLMLYRCSDRNR